MCVSKSLFFAFTGLFRQAEMAAVLLPPLFVFYDYFLGAAHASLSVAKLWSASEVRKVSAWERALPSPLPRFFEKNRVKLLILRTFLCHFNASADSYVSAKLVFRQSGLSGKPEGFFGVRRA